jgi:hypothetical protein
VYAHAFDAADSGTADRHLWLPIVPTDESPLSSGGEVAQDRRMPAGEHRGHETALQRDRVVADRVHAAMNPVQASVLDANGDGVGGHATLAELPHGDLAVLSTGPARDS